MHLNMQKYKNRIFSILGMYLYFVVIKNIGEL